MGLFYANLTVYPPHREALLDTLRRLNRTAFTSPTVDGYTVVFDQDNDNQDFDDIQRLGCEVTGGLSCAGLAAVLHDDDVLYLWLFRDGEVQDHYNSLPQYFDPKAEPGPPIGGNGKLFCEAFDRAEHHEQVERLLRANLLKAELPEIPGELERHRAIAEELGIPPLVAGLGYGAIAAGYLPAEFQGTVLDSIRPPG
jgi:hypothetical protein